jgi:hypothetical protein
MAASTALSTAQPGGGYRAAACPLPERPPGPPLEPLLDVAVVSG